MLYLLKRGSGFMYNLMCKYLLHITFSYRVSANNFGGQEPGSNEEIKEFCSSKFDVTFPMAAKASMKGNDIDPSFKWLTNNSENGVLDANIVRKFNKFLLDENGKLIQHFSCNVEPMSEAITKYLQ
jgi:glutathione peroxidase